MPVAVVVGVLAGALYTVSPLTAWCIPLGAIVFALAGRGLERKDRQALNTLLIAALAVRLAAIGALVVINAPMHDSESVGMLTGDEAYNLSRALRTRNVITGEPVAQYDYFVAYDEYGRTSYIPLLTAIQVLFGPTPYSMRVLNTILFLVGAILLFRMTLSAFGRLPAFGGLAVLLFLPTLFYWSISLLREPLYMLGSALVLTGAVAAIRPATWQQRLCSLLPAVLGLAIVVGLRPGAVALALLGLATGLVIFVVCASPPRVKSLVLAAALVAITTAALRPATQQRIISALESTAKTHAGHVFTVGHSYKLLDDGFYFNPVAPAASTLTLTPAEAARYVIRSAASFVAVPLPWQLASTRELTYLPEQLVWYVLIAFVPFGLLAGWRRDPIATALLAGFVLPTSAALALTNGNVGTLLRLRGIVVPYLVWISAVGFCQWLQRSAARTATA